MQLKSPSNSQNRNTGANMCSNTLFVRTNTNKWVIPSNPNVFKQLIATLSLKASDLKFKSNSEKNTFIKNLFLLALEDECKNDCPSLIANFARDLLAKVH